MYNYFDNSDKVLIVGEKFLSLFKRLSTCDKICK